MAAVIQVDAWDSTAGAVKTIRAASHNDPAVCHMGGQVWWPAITKLPQLRYDLFDGAFGGGITAPTAAITLTVEPLGNVAPLTFADARFRLWTGDVGAAFETWTLRVDGRVAEEPQIADGIATLTFGVDDRWLDAPLLKLYAGTTGAEGSAEQKGVAKPLALGAPRYVPGVLIDNINTILQLSGYGAIQDVESALEKLSRFGPSAGDWPSYAALRDAPIARGRWGMCKALGLVRHGAPLSGQPSYLVRGDNAGTGGWVRKPGAIIRRIAEIAGAGDRVSAASLTALDAARPWTLSLWVAQQTTARDLIQRIATSVNAVAGVSWLGDLFVLPIGIGAAGLTLRSDGTALPPVGDVSQVSVGQPYWRIGLQAERTWQVHALSDVAFTAPLIERGLYDPNEAYREGNIVTLPDGSRWLYVATTPAAGQMPASGSAYWSSLSNPVGGSYADGTSIDALRPAEPGADVTGDHTANNTANVGDKAAEQVVAELNLNGFNALYATALGQTTQAIVDARTKLDDGTLVTVAISNLQSVVEGDDGNAIQTLNLIGAKQPGPNGGEVFVIGTQTALGSPDKLLSQTIDVLENTVGGHEASITSLKEIVTTPNGSSELRALTTLNSDGVITGTINTLTGGRSRYAILADEFRVVSTGAGGVAYTPFSIIDGQVTMLDVVVKKLSYEALVPLFGGENSRLNPASGFQILPGGFIIQWGQYRQAGMTQANAIGVTFQTPFPNALMSATAMPFINSASTANRGVFIQSTSSRSKTMCIFQPQASSGSVSIDGFDWMAFGY